MKYLYVIESDEESEKEKSKKSQHPDEPPITNVDSGEGELYW